VGDEVTEDMPSVTSTLAKARPIYDTLPGWKEKTRGITDYAKLPKRAREFVEHIENLCGKPVILVSTGPGRDETIVKN
jgi:adenylosuccinate synthase